MGGAMARRAQSLDPGLSTRQRLMLFSGTSVSAETVLGMEDSDIDAEFIKKSAVKASSMVAACIGPRRLKAMGVESAQQLRELGFDALYLADSKFASEANAAFGAAHVVNAFLVSASDAVAIAGSDAVNLLGISTCQLLDVCAAAPIEAVAVLQQLPSGALSGVPCKTILDAGLRKQTLMDNGYSLAAIVKHTRANANELSKLGFTM